MCSSKRYIVVVYPSNGRGILGKVRIKDKYYWSSSMFRRTGIDGRDVFIGTRKGTGTFRR